jgi:mannitol-1-/sugar-/sorbitol-6-/2-deoxyglucose-6-phosphatase
VDIQQRGIIFDMDGLLIDSEIVWEKVEADLLATHGTTFDREIARKHMGMRIDEAAAVMVREYGLSCDPIHFSTQLVDALLAEFDVNLDLMPGAAEVMAQAAALGVPVAIASSSPMRVVQYVVTRFDWHNTVAFLCAGDEVARGKPSPEVFLLAAERMGVAPENCLVLEDSVNGARAARAAGMRCIAVPNHAYDASHFEGIADWVIPTLEGLDLQAMLYRGAVNTTATLNEFR